MPDPRFLIEVGIDRLEPRNRERKLRASESAGLSRRLALLTQSPAKRLPETRSCKKSVSRYHLPAEWADCSRSTSFNKPGKTIPAGVSPQKRLPRKAAGQQHAPVDSGFQPRLLRPKRGDRTMCLWRGITAVHPCRSRHAPASRRAHRATPPDVSGRWRGGQRSCRQRTTDEIIGCHTWLKRQPFADYDEIP